MNKKTILPPFLIAALLGACHGSGSSHVQLIQLDSKTSVAFELIGTPTVPGAVASAIPGPQPGEAIHRVLKTPDGKVLFAYDIQPGSAAGGVYRFLVKPVAHGTTISAVREEVVRGGDDWVRVALMEDRDGREIVDQFRVIKSEPLESHLGQIHNAIFRWVHGQ